MSLADVVVALRERLRDLGEYPSVEEAAGVYRGVSTLSLQDIEDVKEAWRNEDDARAMFLSEFARIIFDDDYGEEP